MKTVITYGTYDLLHFGHIRLLERAKEMGDYLIVGVTSDSFDRQRGKLNVRQPLAERMEAVRETGLADLIIVEEYEGQKIEDIQKYHADIFTVGSDWFGKFDYLKKFCEVRYLERTKGISSTEIRENSYKIVKLGCVGMEAPSERFLKESRFVSGLEISGCIYDCKTSGREKLRQIVQDYKIVEYENYDDMLRQVNAVYIAVSREKNYQYIKEALKRGIHVICETPAFLKQSEAKELLALARSKNLVLMEAVKTLYFPAFQHLMLLIASGVIGDVVHIDVSCSQDNCWINKKNLYEGSLYDFGAYVMLPIIKCFGTEYLNCHVKNIYDKETGFCLFTSGFVEYKEGSASFNAGKGIKTEGELIIVGTEGYIYVPAPWWKTEYFELRYEDLRNTRKYFYKCSGEGLRYELAEFIKEINLSSSNSKWSWEESLTLTKMIEESLRPTAG